MMKTFKKIWWRLLFALYAFIYLPWFFYLEHKITMDYPGIHILNGTIDSYIPFLEIFIIPYLLWFVYIAASCIYMVLKADNKEFIRFALSLIIGMSVSMFICILICLSTIFLKQHSVYDVIGGIVLMAFMYFMLYILPERNAEAKCEAESQQSITD